MKILKIILITGFLFGLQTACDKEPVPSIPIAQVNLELDLLGLDNKLNGSLSFIEYTVPRKKTERLGFGGILVVNGRGEGTINLFAYDLACPNEAKRDTRIKPQSSGLQAICPKCNAVYNIANGLGHPESGSKYRLGQYTVVTVSEGVIYKVVN